MKKYLILLASAGLLVLTSCGTKKAEPTVVPLYNTPASTQQSQNQGQTQTNQPSYGTVPSSNTTRSTRTIRRNYVVQQKKASPSQQTVSTQTTTQQATYAPYPGYTSDFTGAYPQVIYNYLASPTSSSYPGQPGYPQYPVYDFYDRTAPYNSVNAPR